MERGRDHYFRATRHPWPCLLLLLPLLVIYEGGVVWLGGTHPDALRSGADTWLRWALEAFGLRQLYWAPALIAVVLLGWSWLRRGDRPQDLLGVGMGMGLESVLFAVGLWGISRGLGPLLDSVGVRLSNAPPTAEAISQVISFVGAGIYEEVLFRLVIFLGLSLLLRLVWVPKVLAVLFAAVVSSALFATAHHIGPYGEDFDSFIFVFRMLAGMYFAMLFQLRGFGIAVGTHACYDVLVGVVVT